MSQNIKYQKRDKSTGACAYDYIKESCKMVQGWSKNEGCKFKNNLDDAMPAKYCPEIDISAELGDD